MIKSLTTARLLQARLRYRGAVLDLGRRIPASGFMWGPRHSELCCGRLATHRIADFLRHDPENPAASLPVHTHLLFYHTPYCRLHMASLILSPRQVSGHFRIYAHILLFYHTLKIISLGDSTCSLLNLLLCARSCACQSNWCKRSR